MTSYDGDDFYCDVAIPRIEDVDVIHEDDRILAFHHTRPFWQEHIVVVPKKHIPSMTDTAPEDRDHLVALLTVVQSIARRVERERGAASVTTNLGAYQDSMHLHIHVHSGSRVVGP